MPNLIDELGSEYITQMYSGAIFLHNDVPHMLDRVRDGRVACYAVDNGDWHPTNLSWDDFPDMAKFSWPALGYRNVDYKKHTLVVEVCAQRSTKRGLRTQLLSVANTKAGALFNVDLPPPLLLGNQVQQAYSLLKPRYFTLEEARTMLHDGKAVSCAISANLAIEINPFSARTQEMSVLYRGAKIGAMLQDGTLEVPNQLAKRFLK